jgi:hypothetical protein
MSCLKSSIGLIFLQKAKCQTNAVCGSVSNALRTTEKDGRERVYIGDDVWTVNSHNFQAAKEVRSTLFLRSRVAHKP